ncbi:hypothetical protein ACIQWA_07915 [Kitasatospora sp. NPDC098652]|uniref:hypothetical protein n=1 Tax=Kitasatospora sp. NPDC098652 TaxID=3364095 RepID=UPI003810B681
MEASDPAYILATARAQGLVDTHGLSTQTVEAAQRRAVACGRLLVECAGPVPPPALTPGRPGAVRHVRTLGWSVPPVPEETAAYPVKRLSPTQSVTFAVCLAAGWRDVRLPPYPGEPFDRALIIDTLMDIGADSKTVKDALDTELPLLLLIYSDGAHLRLGPAVAALPDTFTEAVRRMHDHLPRPPQAANRPAEEGAP